MIARIETCSRNIFENSDDNTRMDFRSNGAVTSLTFKRDSDGAELSLSSMDKMIALFDRNGKLIRDCGSFNSFGQFVTLLADFHNNVV